MMNTQAQTYEVGNHPDMEPPASTVGVQGDSIKPGLVTCKHRINFVCDLPDLRTRSSDPQLFHL